MLSPWFMLCCLPLHCPTWWRGTTKRVCVWGVSPISSSWTSWIGTVPTLMLAYNIMPTRRGLSEAWGIFQVDSMQVRLSADSCQGTSLPAQEVCSERAAMDIVKSGSWKGREAARASPAWAAECKERAHWKAPSWRDKANGGRERRWFLKHFLGQGWGDSDVWCKYSLQNK